MKESITFYDFLLLPVYLSIFYFIILRYKKRHFGKSLTGKLFLYGFNVKMIGTIAFIFLTEYILKGGDSSMYFNEGVTMNKIFLKDFSNFLFLFKPAIAYHDYKMAMGDGSYEGYLFF